MYLFFDTETTGLPKNWKAPVTDLENWPRMIQIAWILCDEAGNKLDTQVHIIKPISNKELCYIQIIYQFRIGFHIILIQFSYNTPIIN